MVQEIGHIVKIGIKITIGEEEIIVTDVTTETIDTITEIIVDPEKGTVMETAIGRTIDQITKEMIAIKGIVIEVKIVVDQGTETGEIGVVPRECSQSRSESQNRYNNKRQSRDNTRNRDRSESRSSSHLSTNRDRSRCYRCNEYNHFARECPNNNSSSRHTKNVEDSLLRMTDAD